MVDYAVTIVGYEDIMIPDLWMYSIKEFVDYFGTDENDGSILYIFWDNGIGCLIIYHIGTGSERVAAYVRIA
jgi:hypothetical protein